MYAIRSRPVLPQRVPIPISVPSPRTPEVGVVFIRAEEPHYGELTKASKTVEKQITQAEKQITEAERKIGDATLHAHDEFLKTLEEMNREVMSRMAAEVERGVKLSTKLSAARSLPDAVAAYQEWMSEETNARSEDARRFMANSQKFMTTSTRLLSNGWSGAGKAF